MLQKYIIDVYAEEIDNNWWKYSQFDTGVAFARNRWGSAMNKEEKKNLLIYSLMANITFVLLGPIEFYIKNYSEFSFGLKSFIFWVLVTFIILSALEYLGGILLYKINAKRIYVYFALLFSIGLMFYIQGNFLSVKSLGVMNGAEVYWEGLIKHNIIDSIIWITAIILCCFLSKYEIISKAEKIFSRLFVAFQAVLLVILFITADPAAKEPVASFVSDKNIMTVSNNQNVIVFCLDMFDKRYLDTILQTNRIEIEDNLSGFTYFDNCSGNYSTTSYSVPSLLADAYLLNGEDSFGKIFDEAFERNELFERMSEKGFHYDVYTYQWAIPTELRKMSTNFVDNSKITIKTSDIPAFLNKMYRLVACKYAPDIIKHNIWCYKNPLNDYSYLTDGYCNFYSVENLSFRKELNSKPLEVCPDKRFKFIHLDACHYPYLTDENMNEVNLEGEESIMAPKTGLGVLRMLFEFFDKLKTADIYDDTLIIITADHGFYWAGTLCSPVMLIKPFNSDSEFNISSVPVSLFDLQATIADQLKIDCCTNGLSMLKAGNALDRERLFYQYYLEESPIDGKWRLIEYSVDPEGIDRKNFTLTDREFEISGEIKKHSDDCIYCNEHGIAPVDGSVTEKIVHRRISSKN